MTEDCSDFELLKADIHRQPDVLAEGLPYLRETAELAGSRLQTPSRVYLVACGDGLSAALAACYTWERLLDCPVEAVPAMTFSRYTVNNASPEALAVVISQSGKVIRVIEALASALRRGLQTLVVANRPDSPLASLVSEEHIFRLNFTRLGFTPGASAYTYTLAALYELAAVLSFNEELAMELRQRLDQTPQEMAKALAQAWEPAGEFAGQLKRNQTIITLGSGPAYGTAHYTMRKLYEICQSKAALLETEEYAHDAYYALDEDTPTILYAPPDAGLRRCVEVAGFLAEIGCPLMVVSGEVQRRNFPGSGIIYAGLPGADPTKTTLTYAVAAQALACQAGQLLGGTFYACNNPRRYLKGDAQIYESRRMDLDD